MQKKKTQYRCRILGKYIKHNNTKLNVRDIERISKSVLAE